MITFLASTFLAQDPTKYGEVINQLGQAVTFYEHPKHGDLYPVIGVIEQTAFVTDFFDTEDFYKNSDYNPVLKNGAIINAYEL